MSKTTLETEKKELLDRKREIEHELTLPTITEVSFEQVNTVLNDFSKIITKAEPEKQKDLLHTIINKITINAGNSPDQRSVKDIELFFDASLREEFVLTYDTVQLNGAIGENCERSLPRHRIANSFCLNKQSSIQ